MPLQVSSISVETDDLRLCAVSQDAPREGNTLWVKQGTCNIVSSGAKNSRGANLNWGGNGTGGRIELPLPTAAAMNLLQIV